MPYYTAFVKPQAKLGRHFFWSNFDIPKPKPETLPRPRTLDKMCDDFGHIGSNRGCRNMVDPEIGKYVYECMEELI